MSISKDASYTVRLFYYVIYINFIFTHNTIYFIS